MSDPIINNPDDDRAWCEAARCALHAYIAHDPDSSGCAHAECAAEDADALLAERRKRMAAAGKKPARCCERCKYWYNDLHGLRSERYGTCKANGPLYALSTVNDFGCIHWEAKP